MTVTVDTSQSTLIVGSAEQGVAVERKLTVIDHAGSTISVKAAASAVSVASTTKVVNIGMAGIQGPAGPQGPPGNATDPEDLTLNYTSGQLSSVVRESGEQKTLVYDVEGRLSTVTDSETGITKTLAYDPSSGDLLTVTISP